MTMCLNIIKVSIEMNNYALVGQYVGRAEQVGEDDVVTLSKIRVASALTELDSKKYRSVARKLTKEIDIAIGSSFNDVVSAQDIAIIGGLCALATYDRRELKLQVRVKLLFVFFLNYQLVANKCVCVFRFSKTMYSKTSLNWFHNCATL